MLNANMPSLLQCVNNKFGNTAGAICFFASYKVMLIVNSWMNYLQPSIIRGYSG